MEVLTYSLIGESKAIIDLLNKLVLVGPGTILSCDNDEEKCRVCESKSQCRLYITATEVLYRLPGKLSLQLDNETWEKCLCQILRIVPMKLTLN